MTDRILFQNTQFLKSAAQLTDCPEDIGTEIAFAGRSNAGKSSVINTLCQQKHLARTSQTPGRTQLINFFTVIPDVRLVDLPGYGYAKVSKSIKQEWHELLDIYSRNRLCLRGIVLIMDIRHPLTAFDEQMVEWTTSLNIPLHALLNKADKLRFGAAKSTLFQVSQKLSGYPHVSVQLFSALKREGVEGLSEKLTEWVTADKA